MHVVIVSVLAVGVIGTPLKTKPVLNYREDRSNLYDGLTPGLLMPGDNPYPNGNAPYFGHNDTNAAINPDGIHQYKLSQMVINVLGCASGYRRVNGKCVPNPCEDGQAIVLGNCVDEDK